MASWNTPTTHSTGDTLAVTDWNVVANNTTFLYEAPYGSYYNSVATSLANGANTQVTLGGTNFSGYGFSVLSNNIVVPLTAIYWVSGQCLSSSASGVIATLIAQNGSLRKESVIVNSASAAGTPPNGLFKCTASDTIGLFGFQNSGGPLNTSGAAATTWLDCMFIGSV